MGVVTRENTVAQDLFANFINCSPCLVRNKQQSLISPVKIHLESWALFQMSYIQRTKR